MKACPRPHLKHRFFARVENFGVFCALTNVDFFAISFEYKLRITHSIYEALTSYNALQISHVFSFDLMGIKRRYTDYAKIIAFSEAYILYHINNKITNTEVAGYARHLCVQYDLSFYHYYSTPLSISLKQQKTTRRWFFVYKKQCS